MENKRDIFELYDLDLENEIGSGAFGKVIKSKNLKNEEYRAIKIIPKRNVKNKDNFYNEINILKSLNHPNIIKFYEFFEDNINFYMVLELCEGGELFERIIENEYFNESEAKVIFLQIMKCLDYCHKNGICHRDLKPENFIFLNETKESPLKLIDFGLSKKFIKTKKDNENLKNFESRKKQILMKTQAGTPFYIAPEVLTGEYDYKCDIWSAGVILYVLLCGYPPFAGNSNRQILESVKKGLYKFETEEWDDVSDSVKDLISKILTHTKKRIDSEGIFKHEWMSYEIEEKDLKSFPLNKLRNYVNENKLKKQLLNLISKDIDMNGFEEINIIFTKIDKNNDGFISFEEFISGFEKLNFKNNNEIKEIFNAFDIYKTNVIDWHEFLTGILSYHSNLKEKKINDLFYRIDKNGDEKISKEEIKELIGDDEDYNEFFDKYDLNNDGFIDKNEFLNIFN